MPPKNESTASKLLLQNFCFFALPNLLTACMFSVQNMTGSGYLLPICHTEETGLDAYQLVIALEPMVGLSTSDRPVCLSNPSQSRDHRKLHRVHASLFGLWVVLHRPEVYPLCIDSASTSSQQTSDNSV